jgi:hypothetical protein
MASIPSGMGPRMSSLPLQMRLSHGAGMHIPHYATDNRVEPQGGGGLLMTLDLSS